MNLRMRMWHTAAAIPRPSGTIASRSIPSGTSILSGSSRSRSSDSAGRNPNNFRKYRLGLGLTASAGVIANLLTALLIYPIYLVCLHYLPVSLATIRLFLCDFTRYIFIYSLCFAVFNLLPLYPLDGFRIVDALNRRRGKVYRFLRDNGQWILLGLVAESFLCSIFVRLNVPIMNYFNLLGWLSTFAVNYVGFPIQALWGLIPW